MSSGAPLHQPRQRGEQPGRGLGGAGRADPAAPHGEEGGEEGDGGEHVDQDHGAAAVGHGAQERVGEDQQAGQGGRHREAREHHRAAGGGGRRLDRGREVAGGPLLAEPGHQQQGVVDGQAEAEHGDHVDRVDRHLGDRADPQQGEQGPGHPDQGDQHGQAGGDDAAEDHQQQHQHHRHGQQLGPGQVGPDLVLELLVLEGPAADHDARGVQPAQLGLGRLKGLVEPVLVEAGGELDRDQDGPAVAGDQLGRVAGDRVGDLGHPGDGPQPLHGGPDVGGHHRVARVDAVGHGGDGLATGVEGVQAGLGPGRLGPLHVAHVGVEAFEDAAADGDPGDEQDHPGGGDQPPVRGGGGC